MTRGETQVPTPGPGARGEQQEHLHYTDTGHWGPGPFIAIITGTNTNCQKLGAHIETK